CKGAVGFGRTVVFLRVVFFHEELAARQLFSRRALAESERTLCKWSKALDIGVGDNAGCTVEHGLDAQFVHLRADADADRGQSAEIAHVRIDRLDLSQLARSFLLLRRHPKL